MAESGHSRSLARTVIGGTGLIAAAGGISKLFTLVSAPILTRALGPSPYGEMALVGTVTALATTASLLGVDLSYSRFFFGGDREDAEAVERFCWRFSVFSALAMSVAAGVLWWRWSLLAGLPAQYAPLVGAGILLAVANTMAGTRRRLKGSYLRIAASIVAAGGAGAAVSILLALAWRSDAWALLVGSAVGGAVGIALLGLPHAGILFRRSGLPPSRRWAVIRLGMAGAVTAPMYWLMNSADRWLIGLWQGQGELGVYSFASGVGLTGILLNSALTLTWFPEMSREFETTPEGASERIGRLWGRMVAGLLVVWLAVAAAGGDALRLVSAPQFHQGAAYVPWIAAGVFFYGVASLANTGLVLRKTLAPAAAWWVVGAAANVLLNVLLVRSQGAMGAAVAACMSYAVIAWGVMRSAQARYPIPVQWWRLLLSGTVALAAGAVMFPSWAGSPVASLALKFPVGAAIAALLLRIVAPDWMDRIRRGEWIRAL